MRPIIGITCDFQTVINSRGAREDRYFLKKSLADAVAGAGGVPFLLPFAATERDALQTIGGLDGLLISGGDFDIPPSLYGERRLPQCSPSVPERTRGELLLMRKARDKGIPVFGVCGGCQLINIHSGGDLYQDIPSQINGAGRHSQKERHARVSHTVQPARGSLLGRITGGDAFGVNSTHHQSVKTPGRGLVATALAPDGVIEAVEAADGRFVLGVQWHPEYLTRRKAHAMLFRAFVKAAEKRR